MESRHINEVDAMLVFISGGVRSGKSSFAESLVDEFKNKVYIATAKVTDDEMKDRVLLHQERRDGYRTIEASHDLDSVLNDLNTEDVVLLDCLTNWLTNEMFQDEIRLDVVGSMYETILRMNEKVKSLVIVSNDVFQGVSNYDAYTMRFLQNLGELHQRVVKEADEVYELYAGIKLRRK